MGAKLKLNLENCTLEEIQVAQNCAPTKEGFKIFFALEFLYKGSSLKDTANHFNVSIRTVQRWVKQFNDRGIEALTIKGKSGRPRKIDVEKFQAVYVPLVLEPDKAGESHWSAIKFHGYICEQHKEQLSYATLLNYFHENNGFEE